MQGEFVYDDYIDQLVAEWSDVYKKGQLSLWVLIAIADGRKYAAQINEYMVRATGGTFDIKEQSLYRALRRFEGMKLVKVTEEASPSSGTKRKYFELTETGVAVLGRFITMHIAPLYEKKVMDIVELMKDKGE